MPDGQDPANVGSVERGKMRTAAKFAVGLVVLAACTTAYLFATGERGLSARDGQARTLVVSRLSAGETTGLGWSPEGLDAAFEFAASLSTDALAIVTGGRTVASFGDPGRAYDIHSIRKALLSAILGQHIGTGHGRISLADTLSDLNIDEVPRPLTALQKTATVRHLLRSVSGINRPAAGEGGLTAEKNRLLGKGENTPGTKWAYNNWDYNVLTTIFERRTGLTVAEAFLNGIARPAGMQEFTKGAVRYMEEPKVSRHRAAAFEMSTRDLVRFGQLYLDRGRIGGREVIPAGWIDRIHEDMTPTGRNDLRWGHGYLWWVPGPDTGLPKGTYWAWGLGNQAVFVIPAWDTVIVHQADTTEFRKRFFPAAERGGDAEAVLLKMIRDCRGRDNRGSEYCVEHRFITRREFDGLIARIVDARL